MPLQKKMKQIIHLNNTFISSIDELKEEMQNNYLKQHFRRDVLSFFKDGVLGKWLEEDKVGLTIPFEEDKVLKSSDNELYDIIHVAIVGNHVKEQIKSDFFEYFTIDCCEYKQEKTKPFKTASYVKDKGYYTIPPKCVSICFSFKIINIDNNVFNLSLGEQLKTIDLKEHKRGEIVRLEFEAELLNQKKDLSLIEGSNIICELHQKSNLEMKRMNLPPSIKELIENLRPVTKGKEKFRCTETMITQKQYKEVIGYWPNGNDVDEQFPAYFEYVSYCDTFISQLNRLTKRKFILPDSHYWNLIVDGDVRTNLPLAFSGSPHTCKEKGCNKKGIYNTTDNIMEFLQDGYYVLKDSHGCQFTAEKRSTQIGFHLIEIV